MSTKTKTPAESTFTSKVRKNKIPQPSHPLRFSAEKWEQAFKASPSTDADKRLYESGKWFAPHFKAIADRAAALNFGVKDRTRLVQLHCAMANRDAQLVRGMTLESTEKSDFLISEQLLQARYKFKDTGIEARPDDIIEAAVDGLQFSLDSLGLSDKREHFPSPSSQDEALGRLRTHFNLGNLFDVLVDLWNACVWNDWYVDETGPNDLVRPNLDTHGSIAVAHAASKHRLDALTNEINFQTLAAWKSISLNAENRSKHFTRIQSITGSGKSKKLHFERDEAAHEEPSLPFQMRMITESLYFSAMLDFDLPRTPSITLKVLLNAWEALFYLSEALFKRLPSDSSTTSLNKLGEYCPTVTQDELLTVIRKALNCSAEQAQTVLSYFIGETPALKPPGETVERSELWHKPLIRLDKGRFIPVLAAMNTPNLVRCIEFWTREGGLNLEDRGDSFEEYARDELAGAIAASPLGIDAGVLKRDINLPANLGGEQIDIAFWIGNTLAIGEAKCILLPTSPHSEHTYYETLMGAVAQIERKHQKLLEHLNEALAYVHRSKGWKPELVKLVPFVLTSTPIGAGLVIRGVPILDIRILCRYFDTRQIQHLVWINESGDHEPGKVIHFYKNATEAEENLHSYLLRPPQLALPKRFVSVDARPVILPDLKKPTFVCTPQVKLPLEDDKYLIKPLPK